MSVTLASACHRDPDTQARKYAASGDAYQAKGQLKQSVIEYKRAVQSKPDWAEAHYKLAQAYTALGDPMNAYKEYAWAGDLDTSNADAEMKAGTFLLAAGDFAGARARAELALKAAPTSAPANILLGNALAGLKQTDKAIDQIQQAINLDPSYAPAWTALGAVEFLGGTRERAGDAFKKAVELAPDSIDARLALANYQWAAGDTAAAEATLQAALLVDDRSTEVHRALALLYLATRRPDAAEPHFKELASQPGGQLALADYYTGIGRQERALEVLRQIESGSNEADANAAKLRIAGIDYVSGRKPQALTKIDALVRDNPKFAEARIAKARILLADGKAKEGLDQAREAVTLAPGSPAAHYVRGVAALANGDANAAEESFKTVLNLNPRAALARMQLARIQLAQGRSAEALQAAEAVSRQHPEDVEAAVLMSRSLRAKGDLPRAERELATRISTNPGAAPLHLEMGWVALQRNQLPAARKSFEDALRLAPNTFDALVGLVTVDIAQKDLTAARARVAGWQQRAGRDPRLDILSARVALAAGNTAEAEQTLRALVTADPSQLDAYDLLGRIAMANGQLDRALAEYQSLASRSKAPAGPLTLVAMIQDARGDHDAARQEYERVIALDPKAGVAANNLAWMYAEAGKLDEAVRLATVARDQLKRPEAEDTLGWAYYRKGLMQHAIAAFERAADKAPANPVYQYHLGLAHLKDGNDSEGRAALKRALALKTEFNGADDARRALEETK